MVANSVIIKIVCTVGITDFFTAERINFFKILCRYFICVYSERTDRRIVKRSDEVFVIVA